MIEPIKYTDGASVIAAASALRKKMLSVKSPHKDTFLEKTRKKEPKLKSGEENFDKITSRRGFTAAAYQRGLAIANERDRAKDEALNGVKNLEKKPLGESPVIFEKKD